MSNLNKNLRIFPILGISLTLIGYLFLVLQTYNLQRTKSNLINDINILKQIKARQTAANKLKDTIIVLQNQIISQSPDERTKIKGADLIKDFQVSNADHFLIRKKAENNMEQAQIFELQGFNFLLDKDVNNAITAFRKSENSYNSFHMVYDLASYLNINKSKLITEDPTLWRQTYLEILKNYSWKMPTEIKSKLTELSK